MVPPIPESIKDAVLVVSLCSNLLVGGLLLGIILYLIRMKGHLTQWIDNLGEMIGDFIDHSNQQPRP